MGKFRETKIAEIPEDELILKEGILQSMRLHAVGNMKYTRYPFKYVLTDKGIWTKGRGFLFIKGKVGFIPYSEISSYRVTRFLRQTAYIFLPKNGKKPGTRIFFDDADGAIAVLDTFIPKTDPVETDAEE